MMKSLEEEYYFEIDGIRFHVIYIINNKVYSDWFFYPDFMNTIKNKELIETVADYLPYNAKNIRFSTPTIKNIWSL